jgi:cob(I)alamin adenosyltransferase
VGGARVGKDSLRIRTFGAYDELNAVLGRARAALEPRHAVTAAILDRLQHELFVADAELATPAGAEVPSHRIGARHVRRMEEEIDRLMEGVPDVRTFVLPRGRAAGAELHVARTVARRAERELWALHATESQRTELLEWANRLSDLLFALALAVNRQDEVAETPPDYTI